MAETDVEFTGLRHQCDVPDCHVAGYVKTLMRMADERFPQRVLDDLKSHAEAWNQGYAAACNDERESTPDRTKNPYGAGI